MKVLFSIFQLLLSLSVFFTKVCKNVAKLGQNLVRSHCIAATHCDYKNGDFCNSVVKNFRGVDEMSIFFARSARMYDLV